MAVMQPPFLGIDSAEKEIGHAGGKPMNQIQADFGVGVSQGVEKMMGWIGACSGCSEERPGGMIVSRALFIITNTYGEQAGLWNIGRYLGLKRRGSPVWAPVTDRIIIVASIHWSGLGRSEYRIDGGVLWYD